MSGCCLKGFQWDEQPKGKQSKLGDNDCYVTGSNPNVGIMVIHDLFGWTFPNIRLLADHYAEEVDATVYVPDFFGGEVLPPQILAQGPANWGSLDIPAFMQRNSKTVRRAEIVECARLLRSRHGRTGAIGFCYGGWAVFHLGDTESNGQQLVDCISTPHPSLLEKEEIEKVRVPVQIIAPEVDPVFTEELKLFCHTIIPSLGVAYDYQYFPGVEHAFAIRGDPDNPKERKGMERAKNAAVLWFRQWLHDD